MNAYPEAQTSGNQWRQPMPTFMLDQPLRPTQVLEGRKHGNAIFEDLEKQLVAYTAEHEAVLKELRAHFVMPTDSSVTTFLLEHRAIPQILLESAPHLKLCFGSETIFALRAPIDESGSRTLYAVAVWPGKAQDARNALDKFDDVWWLMHSRRASVYLTFTYELV